MTRIILGIYEIIWTGIIPVLAFVPRIKNGWKERLILREKGPFDIWIHGASVGEVNMAADIVSDLKGFRVLITTNTPQGKEILKNKLINTKIYIRYLPFDMPYVMEKAIIIWKPKIVVLLETELWPALIYSCKKGSVPIIVLNGRLSKKSFKNYFRFKSFWSKFSPDEIYAISRKDADRYIRLFGEKKVRLMNNMKFDRININKNFKYNKFLKLIPKHYPFIVLGSIRKEEEMDILFVIQTILSVIPEINIGLFPRHIDRVKWWKNRLNQKGIPYILRSRLNNMLSAGNVIIWDKFGELEKAYAIADTVFVGGSLRPCGGHNFLEPLSFGIVPFVGPFLDNFHWIGKEIFDMKLAIIVNNWKELAQGLIRNSLAPKDRKKIKKRFELFLKKNKGGKKQALDIILNYLYKGGNNDRK